MSAENRIYKQLKKEIEEKRAELAKLETQGVKDSKKEAIKDLPEFSTDEKVKIFDALYNYSKNELEEVEKTGYIDEDSDHYAWETLITILARDNKKFWNYYNSLTK